MTYGMEACRKVFEDRAAGRMPDPDDEKECKRWLEILGAIEELYLIKLFPPPPQPPPPVSINSLVNVIRDIDLGSYFGDPTPQPSVLAGSGMQQVILSELVLDALRRDQPSTTIFGQIRKSGAQREVVQGLLQRFEDATDYLKAELAMLEKDTK